MKKIATLIMILAFVIGTQAQNEFKKVGTLKATKGIVKVLAEDMVVITVDGENQRYMANNLPDEYKKDGLHVTFSGEIGEIPSNVRMAGTPFKIGTIKVTLKDKKKLQLNKRKYKFK